MKFYEEQSKANFEKYEGLRKKIDQLHQAIDQLLAEDSDAKLKIILAFVVLAMLTMFLYKLTKYIKPVAEKNDHKNKISIKRNDNGYKVLVILSHEFRRQLALKIPSIQGQVTAKNNALDYESLIFLNREKDKKKYEGSGYKIKLKDCTKDVRFFAIPKPGGTKNEFVVTGCKPTHKKDKIISVKL